MNEKELITSRAAALLQPGWVVNLGIGIPTLIPRFVDADTLCFQTENGLLGVGSPPEKDRMDPNLVDAGKRPVTERPGASYFDSATSRRSPAARTATAPTPATSRSRSSRAAATSTPPPRSR
jgi:3-oxoacid CoA-transferase subunit B